MSPPPAAATGAAATGAAAAAGGAQAAGAAAATAGAAAAPPSLIFKYSSKLGAALILLRGSSSSNALGSRVSAIPPEPRVGPLNKAVEIPDFCTGEKAEAPTTRAARRATLLMAIMMNILCMKI